MQPTGSKDPFALRRAANAIVKILAESELPLTLRCWSDGMRTAHALTDDVKRCARFWRFCASGCISI